MSSPAPAATAEKTPEPVAATTAAAAETTPAVVAALEADDSESNSDGFYSDGRASSTESLSSSILEHVYENGRRYHRKSSDKYLMPSDEKEQDRLDLGHHIALHLLGGRLGMAEFKSGDPHNVLDAGTGTGIWALDFGEVHTGSQVIGVDLMPIQPSWTYPNVKFETDDLTKDWTYRENFFDYIHSRHLATGIRSWPHFISQAYRHLAPGGTYELSEHNFGRIYSDDDSIPADSGLQAYAEHVQKALGIMGVDVSFSGEDYKRMMEEAGFVDVTLHAFKYPWGSWAKDKKLKYIGAMSAEMMKTGLEAYGLKLLTSVLGMKETEAREVCDKALDDMVSRKVHCYGWQWQIVGRKPKESETA